jgi:hypothetical protein
VNRKMLGDLEARLGIPSADADARLAAVLDRVDVARRSMPQSSAPWCPADCPGLRPGASGLEINNYTIAETMIRMCCRGETPAEADAVVADWLDRCRKHGPQNERPCDRSAVAGCARARSTGRDDSCPYMGDVREMVERFGYPPPRTDAEIAAACRIDAERDAAHEAEQAKRREDATARSVESGLIPPPEVPAT